VDLVVITEIEKEKLEYGLVLNHNGDNNQRQNFVN
jgi:hypothetical protein